MLSFDELIFFRPPTPLELFVFTSLVVGLVGTIIGFLFYDTKRRKRDHLARLRTTIRDQSAERGLTGEESELFGEIVLEHESYPGPKTFELFVDKFLARGVSPDVVKALRTKLGFSKREGKSLASTREIENGLEITFGDATHAWGGVVFSVTETDLALRVPAACVRGLKKGDEVTASLWREDARYLFRTTVNETNLGPVPLVFLKHPSELDRHQDREFIRSDVDWSIKLNQLSEDQFLRALSGVVAPDAVPVLDARVLDISEGGMRLKSVSLSVGDRIVSELPLSTGGLLVVAEVIAVNAGGIRCQFMNLSMGERDQIHREIMKLRRKI